MASEERSAYQSVTQQQRKFNESLLAYMVVADEYEAKADAAQQTEENGKQAGPVATS